MLANQLETDRRRQAWLMWAIGGLIALLSLTSIVVLIRPATPSYGALYERTR